jgi:type VI secretion system secreted protein VgrG
MPPDSTQNSIQASFQPQPPGAPVLACAAGGPTTGLGADVDALAAKSPTMQGNLEKLAADKWTLEYGAAGKGSYCNRDTKTIVVDENEKGHPDQVLQTLSHESGHALYTPDAYVPPAGLTRQEYVAKNVNSALKDEGEATLTNAQVRKEILDNGGSDIGVAGAQGAKYEQLAAQYPDAGDRDVARQKIGDLFADGEHPSTSPTDTYRDYYSKPYSDFYDKQKKGP